MTSPKNALIRSVERLSGFMRDRGGNVAILFGLAVLPVVGLVGVAIDYSRASDVRAQLQRATDATGIQLCQLPNTMTRDEYLTKAKNVLLPSYLGNEKFEIVELSVTDVPHQIKLRTSTVYDTAVVKVLSGVFGSQMDHMSLEADSQCQNQQETFEIALVLDNTGSMAESSGSKSKMDALKDAATNFVNFVYSNKKLQQSKISVVPFSAAVAVNPTTYRYATWIDQAGKASYHWSGLKGGAAAATAAGWTSRFDQFTPLRNAVSGWGWAGCFESLPYPLNVQDGVPTPQNPDSYYVPMLAPDDSGDGGAFSYYDANGFQIKSGNSYIDDGDPLNQNCLPTSDEAIRIGRTCKYKTPKNPQTSNGWLANGTAGPNAFCTSRPLTRLTNDQSLLLSEISKMQPAGNTDIHEGFMWGWRTLAPNGRSVFGDGAAYDKPYNHKIIILMTDGFNTWNYNWRNMLKSVYSSYGYFINADGSNANSRLPPANANVMSDAQSRDAMDALTLEACKNAANVAPALNNITVYTIGFSVPIDPIDQKGIDMLKTCAGSSVRAFIANDSQGIVDAFQKIADAIAGVKLTQ